MKNIKDKKIVFLGHSNNDIDHFLPVIDALKQKGVGSPLLIFLRFEEEAVSNDLHRALFEDINIERLSASDFKSWPLRSRIAFNILRKCYIQSAKKSLVESIKSRRIKDTFYKSVYILMDNISSRFPLLIFPEKAINMAVGDIDPDMLVIDVQVVEAGRKFSDLRSYLLSIIVSSCRHRKIPIFMVTHGVAVRYLVGEHHPFNREGLFKPDMYALSNDAEKNTSRGLMGENVKTMVLGDMRFDKAWVDKIENLADKLYSIPKTEGKTIILYLVGNLRFLNNDIFEKEIHEDVLSLLDSFKDAELWIKLHPRVDCNFLKEGKHSSRIKIFDNKTDTNALIQNADIFISTLSAVLFQVIMHYKPIIFYDKWRQMSETSVNTIFDSSDCVLTPGNKEDLVRCVKEAMDAGLLEKKIADSFYKRSVSGGMPIGGSIVDGYVEEIKNAVRKK